MKEKYTIEDEVHHLMVNVVERLSPGEDLPCDVDANFHGQEARIIEGLKNILKSEGRDDFKISSGEEGHILIERNAN